MDALAAQLNALSEQYKQLAEESKRVRWYVIYPKYCNCYLIPYPSELQTKDVYLDQSQSSLIKEVTNDKNEGQKHSMYLQNRYTDPGVDLCFVRILTINTVLPFRLKAKK